MCYELRMATLGSTLPQIETPALASTEEMESFYQHLEETLLHIGFLNPQAPRRLMTRMRRIYARTGLEKEELDMLRGILKLTQNPLQKYPLK
jgi:tRNA/rRNA methyltransferase